MRTVALTLAAILATSMLAAPTLAGLPIGASAVGCGSTISVSTTLTKDLDCTTDVGLFVQPGVTLDLAGHTISGDGTNVGIALAWPEEAEGAEITVANGIISGWFYGIDDSVMNGPVQGSARLHKLTIAHNEVGVDSFGTDYAITSSRFSENDSGFSSLGTFSTVSDTIFSDNEGGISLGSAGSVDVTRSQFIRSGAAISVSEVGLTVKRSSFRENETAIRAFNTGATIIDNTFARNDIGYEVSEYGWGLDDIVGNRFVDNGVAIDTGISTNLTRNVFTGNGTAFTSRKGFMDTKATLQWNLFAKNGDAVQIDSLGSLRGTVAIKNSGVGIYAPFVTDLGANRAWGNGTQPQCVGVAC